MQRREGFRLRVVERNTAIIATSANGGSHFGPCLGRGGDTARVWMASGLKAVGELMHGIVTRRRRIGGMRTEGAKSWPLRVIGCFKDTDLSA